MQKRYIFVIMIVLVVCFLIWKLSSSYAFYNSGYKGQTIVEGSEWSLNIVDVSEEVLTGTAVLVKEPSTIGTTLNFDVNLSKPGDSLSFNFTVQNMGKLDAMLYKTTLVGLSKLAGEVINYEIIPLDAYVTTDEIDGTILKSGEKQTFEIRVNYQDNLAVDKTQEYNLNLGSTIIYKQK